jgi:hypothetical protein
MVAFNFGKYAQTQGGLTDFETQDGLMMMTGLIVLIRASRLPHFTTSAEPGYFL